MGRGQLYPDIVRREASGYTSIPFGDLNPYIGTRISNFDMTCQYHGVGAVSFFISCTSISCSKLFPQSFTFLLDVSICAMNETIRQFSR